MMISGAERESDDKRGRDKVMISGAERGWR